MISPYPMATSKENHMAISEAIQEEHPNSNGFRVFIEISID